MVTPTSKTRKDRARLAGSHAELDDVVDAALRASRALVAIAARSLATVDADVTLVQYRTLVVLAGRGPQTVGALAAAIGVHPSTATRMCDRLVTKRLIRRAGSADNRRQVVVSLTAKGGRLVDSVTSRRRDELATIVAAIPGREREPTVHALNAFGDAAGEPEETAWFLGWPPE